MHGWSDAVLVYGFNMGDHKFILDYGYLFDKFPGIREYALCVIRNYLVQAIYGLPCGLNTETGEITINNEEKEKVKKLYDKYIDYLKRELSENEFTQIMKEITIGFHLAITGDYEYDDDDIQIKIILEEEYKYLDEDSDEEEEEEEYNIIEAQTYKGVYYNNIKDMELAMTQDAKQSSGYRDMIEFDTKKMRYNFGAIIEDDDDDDDLINHLRVK